MNAADGPVLRRSLPRVFGTFALMQCDDRKRSAALLTRALAALLWAQPTIIVTFATPALWSGAARAADLTTLASFNRADGQIPNSLVIDAAGNLFGTTLYGGGSPSCPLPYSGCGTVFEIPNTGSGYASAPSVLVRFNSANGKFPSALIMDASGNLFGVASIGGASDCGGVFEIAKTPAGYVSTPAALVSFNRANGCYPNSLIMDASGNLFGTAGGGGIFSCFGLPGCGTVFEIAKTANGYAAAPKTLVYFNLANGALPSSLIMDAAGNLLGTTMGGGGLGGGTVFEIVKIPGGYASTPTTLVSFDNNSLGNLDYIPGNLIADAEGNLFGTLQTSLGKVFEIAKTAGGYASTYTTLASFTGSDGLFPNSLIADAKGNLFGTTAGDVDFIPDCSFSGCGTVFEIAKASGGYASAPTTLVRFSYGSPTGSFPVGLIADANGNLFGPTADGAAMPSNCPSDNVSCGTVFELTGTGFAPPPILFGTFSAGLNVAFGFNTDSFNLGSSFTLGNGSNGINPLSEPLALTVGTFTTTIPAGSFKQNGNGAFSFDGAIGSAQLDVQLVSTGTKSYAFNAQARYVNMTGTNNPVPVTLGIGNNTGTVLVTAQITGSR